MTAPKLRFKEFYGDWKITVLGKLASHISYGLTVRPEYIDEGIKLISAREIASGEIDLISAPKISTDDFEKLSDKAKPQKNDLFLSKTGSIGFTAIVDTDEELAITQNIAVIRLNDMEKQIPLFYLHQMRTSSFQRKAISVVNQSTIMDLQLGDIKKIEVSYCNDKEQTKIASFLSAVDEKISQLTQKHRLLCEYKQGMMQKLFSQQLRFKADDGSDFGEWEDKLIKDIADVKGGKRIPKGYSLVNENTGHPYITVSDMNRSYSIDDINIRYVPFEVVETIKRYTITDKDIFISVAGTLGIIGKIPAKLQGANLTENADKLTNLKCHQDFLIYLLDSGCLSELIENTATTSAQPKLALYAIEQLEVKIPCLEEQTKIANFLSAIDQKIEVVAQQIEQAKIWKKGLLQQMFV